MPFTPAHVAAVLPLTGRTRPGWAVPAALVIGSMVPDVLYFVPIGDHRAFSHSLTGVLTLDLVLGLFFLGLWWSVAAPVARDLAPPRLQESLPEPATVTSREWLWALPCLVAGELTHLAWDSFTHAGGWVVVRSAALQAPLPGGLPAYKVAQYASGVLGCLVVLAVAARRLRAMPHRHSVAGVATARQRRLAWVALVALPLLVGVGFAAGAAAAGESREVVLYALVVRALSCFGLLAAGVAAWWHAVARPRSAAGRSAAA